MRCFLKLLVAVASMSSAAATTAFAHAFLNHAVPGVGMTVSNAPRELRLYFTEGVVAAFSGVRVVSATGAPVPAGKLMNDPSDRTVIIVRLGHALKPGTYTVSWHVVSADKHPSQGMFSFTVS